MSGNHRQLASRVLFPSAVSYAVRENRFSVWLCVLWGREIHCDRDLSRCSCAALTYYCQSSQYQYAASSTKPTHTHTHTHTRSCHPHYTYCISQTYVTVGWMGSVCVCVFVSCEFRLCNSMSVAVMVDVGIAPGSPKNAAHWAVCVCVWLGGNALCSHPPTIIPRMQGRTNYVKKRAAARCALVKIQINML